ncbi:MAG: endonuclease/exonuclease/phosphatase family protein [Microscillaceae bacterium]|nr:endonuclease/exonuclease/phosphatase family protein [Microscillaceae bacterium]
MLRFFKWFFGILFLLVFGLAAFIYFANWYPPARQNETIIHRGEASLLKPGQKIKVLSWNVQYFAGKGYVFFYDDGAELVKNPATRPQPADIRRTLAEVARIVNEEDPDIILLQEVDDQAKRTDYKDQLAELRLLISDEYLCHTSSFYWKSAFVPDPKVWGRAGMKLSILSKYKISNAVRHALPLIEYENLPFNRAIYEWFKKQFYIKRAIQEAVLPIEGGGFLVVMNTHLSAFAQGSRTMQKQVAEVEKLLATQSSRKIPWLIGGDFNLLPPGKAYQQLAETHRALYQEKTEIAPLFARYAAFPSRAQAQSDAAAQWFTHFPNDPRVKQPDRTIDYIFFLRFLK